MVEILFSSSGVEINNWMKSLITKKSQRLVNYNFGKDIKLSWRLLSQKGVYETRLSVNVYGKNIHLVKRSEDFKTTIDLLVDLADIELSDYKQKISKKLHKGKPVEMSVA